MFGLWSWWRERRARQNPIPRPLWNEVVATLPLADDLAPAERETLHDLATLFVHDKDFYGAGGLELDDVMIVTIAAQACLPAIHLGWEWLTGWHSIYVYPGQFRTGRAFRDEHGLETIDDRVLSGEAHHDGGLVFSWTDVIEDIAAGSDGQNVVIHEIAHKFDMRNGDADGYPPLRRGMSRQGWTQAMRTAYDAMNAELDRGRDPELDPYAATEPAEFFAVMSEYYFETPRLLGREFPAVREQLEQFYRGVADEVRR
ncbi:MAG: M90 family metallopeptidase [Pseudomonadota bacterium]